MGLVWFCLGISVFSSKNQRGHLVVARIPIPLSSLRFEMVFRVRVWIFVKTQNKHSAYEGIFVPIFLKVVFFL